MKQVWKFNLYPVSNEATLMPEGAVVLSAGFQGNTLCIWALVDPEAIEIKRYFVVKGTGHNVDANNIEFIATTFFDGLVLHVFELI